MKKIITILVASTFIFSISFGQVRANFLLGGEIYAYKSRTLRPHIDGTQVVHLKRFQPSIHFGKYLNKKNILGTRMYYSSHKNFEWVTDTDEYSITDREPSIHAISFGFSLFHRLILGKSDLLKFYIQPSAFIDLNSSTDENGDKEFLKTNRNIGGDISFGLLFNIADHWNIKANLWAIQYTRPYSFDVAAGVERESYLDFDFSRDNISVGAEWLF